MRNEIISVINSRQGCNKRQNSFLKSIITYKQFLSNVSTHRRNFTKSWPKYKHLFTKVYLYWNFSLTIGTRNRNSYLQEGSRNTCWKLGKANHLAIVLYPSLYSVYIYFYILTSLFNIQQVTDIYYTISMVADQQSTDQQKLLFMSI